MFKRSIHSAQIHQQFFNTIIYFCITYKNNWGYFKNLFNESVFLLKCLTEQQRWEIICLLINKMTFNIVSFMVTFYVWILSIYLYLSIYLSIYLPLMILVCVPLMACWINWANPISHDMVNTVRDWTKFPQNSYIEALIPGLQNVYLETGPWRDN